ncbi:MAG: hypothetical protein ACKPB0_19170, partial [Opitutaceae bacterium]
MLYQLSYLGGMRECQKTKRVEKRASRRKHRQQQIRTKSRNSSRPHHETEISRWKTLPDPENFRQNPSEVKVNFIDGGGIQNDERQGESTRVDHREKFEWLPRFTTGWSERGGQGFGKHGRPARGRNRLQKSSPGSEWLDP